MSQNEDKELEPRWDIGINLSAKAWVVLIAAGLALVFALGLATKLFFEHRGPAAVYEKHLKLEEEQ
jgi:hypothetical protein